MINKIPKSILEAKTLFSSGELKPSELVQHYFNVIKEKDADINAVLEIFEDANEAAKVADNIFAAGDKSKIRELEGIPFLIKDCVLVQGHVGSAGSQMLKNFVSPYDATVVKLIKQAGGIILGRTNMDEFALGGSGENSSYGKTKNPIDLERVPGGTSSGSAAALAAGMCLVAIGTDTGGSVRQPASFCGVYALKGTYGVYSRSGLVAAASSLEGPGVIANSVEDIEIVHKIISKEDILDNTSIPNYVRDEFASKNSSTKTKFKIGYPKEYVESEGINQQVRDNFFETLNNLKMQGHEIVPISLDVLKYSLSIYYIINTAEVSTNLSRMDGLRFGGGDVGEIKNYGELFAKNRGNFLGPEVKRRIMIGTYVLSKGYYDAFYGKALQLRTQMKKEFAKIFETTDFLVMPTAPTTAWKFGEIKDPLSLYLEDIFTVPANLAGLPSISIPTGLDSNNMPIGFQILGPYLGDEKVLEFAKSISK